MVILNEKTYDVFLRWQLHFKCNLRCSYCNIRGSLEIGKPSNIHISKLMKTLNGINKIFNINFVGGEPFITPNIIEACEKVTKNHYIFITTNLIPGKIKEFCEKIDPERVEYIYSSLHIKELEKRNLLDKFIDNFHLCEESGFNIGVHIVAFPQLLGEVNKYKNYFKEKGIHLIFKPFIGEYNGKSYPDSYTRKEIEIFNFNRNFLNRFHQKGNLCNVGHNVFLVNPYGNITNCPLISKKMGNIYKKIKFRETLIQCPFKFCGCPTNAFHSSLYKKAIKETNSRVMSSIFLKRYVLKEYLAKVKNRLLTNDKKNKVFTYIRKYSKRMK